MLAARAKADILLKSLGTLSGAGLAAVEGSFDAVAEGNVAATFKLFTCAIPELDDVGILIGGATSSLQGEVSGSLEVFAAAGITG